MRSFRDYLGQLVLVLIITAGSSCSDESSRETNSANRSPVKNAYFPLSVGNFWRYGCGVEGEHQFDKIVKVISLQKLRDVSIFESALTIDGNEEAVVQYFFNTLMGDILVSPTVESKDAQLLITFAPRTGDKIGEFVVGGSEAVTTTAVIEAEAIRLETFPYDDPTISAEKRMEWLGRFYVKGIGLVLESDGLGGECALEEYYLSE